MKKIIIIFALIVMGTVSATESPKDGFGNVITNGMDTVYHDAKDAVKTVYSDAKSTIKDIYPDIKDALGKLADALGCAAEHVYAVLVKKFVVDGIKELSIFIILLTLAVSGIIWMVRLSKELSVINYKYVIPFAMAFIGAIGLFCVDYDAIFMGILNPEYGAINYIIETAKTVVK